MEQWKGTPACTFLPQSNSSVTDLTYCIKKLKLRWTGQVIRNKKDKRIKDVIEWYPIQYKRKKGRQRRRWEDDIKRIAGTTWRRKTQDRRKKKRESAKKEIKLCCLVYMSISMSHYDGSRNK
ncbi:unnamed protein product [Euphydryas editha]|uniref:Endonuclease-reverse transcriptase n=1 Tax=Euphydryas editha TaxID=104508 RepID=A0AAU9UFX2_EUPED|nr:unnamed protein product [Euphydryas editha]